MLLIKVGILLAALCCATSGKIVLKGFNEDSHLDKCVEEIIDSYFNPSDTILYLDLFEKRLDVDFTTFPAIKINDFQAVKNFKHTKPDWYIVTVHQSEVVDVFWFLRNTDNWNPKAKFVLVYSGDVTYLLHVLERFYIVNVAILLERKNTVEIFTYFPYDNRSSNNAVLVAKCVKGHFGKFSNLFPKKLPDKWINQTVNVLFSYYPPYIDYGQDGTLIGIEVELFNVIKKRIGIKVNSLPPSLVMKCDKKRCGPNLRKELYYKLEIRLGLIGESSYLEKSIPYFYDSIQWIVPVEKLDIPWYRLTNIFDYSIWLGLMGAVVIVPFIFYFMGVQTSDATNYRQFSKCLFLTMQCLIGHPVNVLPTTNSVRIFLTGWLMFCCVIIIAYQSRLLWDFYDNTKQISTVKEMLDSKVQIGFPAVYDKYFANDVRGSHILNVKENCHIIDCLNRTVTKKDFVTFYSKQMTLQHNNLHFLGKYNESRIYFLNEELIPFPVFMQFTKGFPLTEDFNKVIRELQENGVTQYLSEKLDYDAEEPIERALEIQYAPHPMDLKKLQGAFWILLFGWTLSTVVLICEIVYSKWVASRKKRIVRPLIK